MPPDEIRRFDTYETTPGICDNRRNSCFKCKITPKMRPLWRNDGSCARNGGRYVQMMVHLNNEDAV